MDIIRENEETWLVCGGRNFSDEDVFEYGMGSLVRMRGMPVKIVQGGARGADAMARDWAKHHAVDVVTEPANWWSFGRSAGPIRNKLMLDKYKPDLVIAFPGGKGTSSMVRYSRAAKIEVTEIEAKSE